MREISLFQLLFDAAWIFCRLEGLQQDPGEFAPVVEITATAIIPPAANKQKVNSCRSGKVLIDVLEDRILAQCPRKVRFSTFLSYDISEGRNAPKIRHHVNQIET